MRFELSGSLNRPDPLVLMYIDDGTFDVQAQIDLGYTHFEVICIGGGGGRGGGINTNNTGTQIRSYGGAGGGGGYHRVRGLLSALPVTCPIVVGSEGSLGTEHSVNPDLTTDGGDGEASTFNTNTCRASGGKGGKRARVNASIASSQADGGDGGIGNRVLAGGGAAGGTAGIPTVDGPGTLGTNGADGTIFNNIGKGGGGGAGGVGRWTGITCNAATSGGRGAFNPGDTAVYGPGDAPTNDASSGANNIVPGSASGAKAAPLNGLPTVYGKSGNPGSVIIRLTADVVTTKTTPPPPVGGLYGFVSRPFIFVKNVLGKKTTFGQVSLATTFVKAVAGNISIKKTTIAEISLASHAAPASRTSHSLKIRARTTSGSGGVIKAALYEGSTNRSGDLTTTPLTNALADYTLVIPDASAAEITSYANLSIRFWGFDVNNLGLVFEIADIYLQLPSA